MVRDEDQEGTITETRREQAVSRARHWPASAGRSSQGSQGGRGLELLDPALKRPRSRAEMFPRGLLMTEGSLELLVPEPDLDLAPPRSSIYMITL